MNVVLARFGRVRSEEIRALVDDYHRRVQSYAKVSLLELRERPSAKEDDALPPQLADCDVLVALDETGKLKSSVEFSAHLREWRDNPRVKKVGFVVGAPFGLDPSIKKNAALLVSLSKMTLPADIAWLVLMEQVYRGYSILAGSPYHHA